MFLELPSHLKADCTPARNEKALDGFLLFSEIGKHVSHRSPINDGIENISHIYRLISMGNDDPIIPRNSHNQHFEIRKMSPRLLKLLELLPPDETVLVDFHSNKLHHAFRKLGKVSRARMFNQSHNGLGRFQFGINAEIDIEMLFVENPSLPGIFQITNAGDPFGDFGLCARYEAGHHVNLVTVRHRNHHFRFFHPGLLQNSWATALAEQRLHIQALINMPDLVGIMVDHHHIMAFIREFLSQIVPDFTRSDDDDVHTCIPLVCAQKFRVIEMLSKQNNPGRRVARPHDRPAPCF